jgi:hypothetical protein
VFALRFNLTYRTGTFGWRIFHDVTAVVMTSAATATVVGVAESAYGMLNQLTLSGEPSIATVTVGVAPIVDVIFSSAGAEDGPRSATFVEGPVPVCAVHRFAALLPAGTVAIGSYLNR